jgi:hypothetical protein
MLANLPPPPRPLDDSEIVEIKEELARLKVSQVIPSPLPPTTESPLRKFGEKVLTQLAVQQGSEALGKEIWAQIGDSLITTAKAFGEWIASVLASLG